MKRTGQHKGFTIVELLTVMAVIALLIGLLVPALSMVKDRGKEIQQRAQFHSVSVGLEMFKADFGDYPESNDNSIVPTNLNDPTRYSGANKLAEAMVGLDYLGFHPNSDFRSTGQNDFFRKDGLTVANPKNVYVGLGAIDLLWQTQEENIKARKGPFLEAENANAFRMDEVYTTSHPGIASFRPFSLVLCDVFAKKRSAANSRKTGAPILYYRARTQFTQQNYQDIHHPSANIFDPIDDDIYYYRDNATILSLNAPDNQTILHPLYANGGAALDWEKFEDMIVNKNIPAGMVRRPYRAGSFILISAGKDGLFGTADDVFNFTREAE